MDLGGGWGLKDCPIALACLCESVFTVAAWKLLINRVFCDLIDHI